MTKATGDWAQAENQRRRLEAELQTEGLKVPAADPAGQSNPLGPSHPIHHDIHGGPIFEYLRDRVAPDSQVDPTAAGRIHFDGDRGRGMLPVVLLGRLEDARQTVVREAEQQRIEAQQRRIAAEAAAKAERERKAREAEQRRIEAARIAEDERQRKIAAYVARLEEAVNRHIENAANVDASDPAAVQRYNDRTDYFIGEYKKWTGKDLTYKYKATP